MQFTPDREKDVANFKSFIFRNVNYVDLILYQFGSENCEPLHTFGPGIKNHYLFHYVISGRGKLYPVDKNTGDCPAYQITEGEGFLITPNTVNTYEADQKHPWTYIWVEFDGLKAKKFLDSIGLSAENPVFHPRTYTPDNEIKEHLTYLVSHPNGNDMELIGHLYLFLNALLENSSAVVTPRSGTLKEFYVREAVNFIEQNYAKNIMPEDVAQWCNLNRSYLGKIFKEIMNSTIQDFLIKYRLNKACEMMRNKNMMLKDVANAAGYPNQFYFSKMFKKEYHMTPREWKNKNSD